MFLIALERISRQGEQPFVVLCLGNLVHGKHVFQEGFFPVVGVHGIVGGFFFRGFRFLWGNGWRGGRGKGEIHLSSHLFCSLVTLVNLTGGFGLAAAPPSGVNYSGFQFCFRRPQGRIAQLLVGVGEIFHCRRFGF